MFFDIIEANIKFYYSYAFLWFQSKYGIVWPIDWIISRANCLSTWESDDEKPNKKSAYIHKKKKTTERPEEILYEKVDLILCKFFPRETWKYPRKIHFS